MSNSNSLIDNSELISIIVPVYNVEAYLAECIDSLLVQTYSNIEIILVDDGSTDNSAETCDKYSARDKRIKVIHKSNGGLSDARNVGIDASQGRYLMFVDSDDYVDKDYVRLLYENLIENQADLSMCGFHCVYPDGKIELGSTAILMDGIIDEEEIHQRMTLDNGWQYNVAWNKLYKRELFDNIRYPIGKLHEDVFVAHHLYHKCKIICMIATPLVFYRRREGSIVLSKMTLNRLINCFEHEIDRYSFYKQNSILHLHTFYMKSVYGKTLEIIEMMDWGNRKKVTDVLLQSVRVLKGNPRTIKCLIIYSRKYYKLIKEK